MKIILIPILNLIWWLITKLWMLITIVWHTIFFLFFSSLYVFWNFKFLKWGVYISNNYDWMTSEYAQDKVVKKLLRKETFWKTIKRWNNNDYV